MRYKNNSVCAHKPFLIRGFTLIELVVVCAIMAILSTLILANTRKFGGAIQLESLAYDLALSIRKVQVYGGSAARTVSGSAFGAGYGVYFSTASTADRSRYTVFSEMRDVGNNGMFDVGVDDGNQGVLRGGYLIDQLCVMTGGTERCSNDAIGAISRIDIFFGRVEPDARISYNGSSCLSLSTRCSENTKAKIVLSSPRGDKVSVNVFNNGQVSVTKAQ